MPQKLNRRQFLAGLLLASGGLVAGRCTPKSGTPTDDVPATSTPVVGGLPHASRGVGRPIQLTVLHINDLHGALYAESKGDQERGGAARLVGLIEQKRAAAPGPVLFLDAGDTLQGTYISNRSRGEAAFEILNAAGLDAMTLGNHEFDWGLDVLRARVQQARFPVLAANLEATSSQPLDTLLPGLSPYTILDAGGVRVGVLGLTYHNLASIVRASAIEGLRTLAGVQAAQRYLPELEDQADLVVVLSHMGLEADHALARALPELPIIVGGHSHRLLREGIRVGQTTIAQAGAYGEYLGVIKLTFDPERGQTADVQATAATVTKAAPTHAKVEAIVSKWAKEVEEAGSQVVGETAIPLHKGRGVETALGNLVTDGARAADLGDGQKADIALYNDGGIRADLDAGPITYAELYSVLPFENSLIGLDLSGAQVRQMLEDGIGDRGSEIQVSGLSFVYDPGRGSGKRVTEVSVGREPLDEQRTYRVVTVDYLYTHPQFEGSLGKGANVVYDGLHLEAVIAYIDAHSPVEPQEEGRIRTQ
jgi:2',3'-cyclic-nucleotide 2'-phosphodiesterase (5'-nucleotidase family)